MLFYISILGVAVAFLLAFFNRNRFVGNYYLVGFFLANSLYSITFYAIYYSPSVVFSAIVHGHLMPFLYLSGPLAYFYVRSLVTDNSMLKSVKGRTCVEVDIEWFCQRAFLKCGLP